MTFIPISDYGLIGNCHGAALVGKNGSIDWCCIPRFDSPSIFAGILDDEKGGHAARRSRVRCNRLPAPMQRDHGWQPLP